MVCDTVGSSEDTGEYDVNDESEIDVEWDRFHGFGLGMEYGETKRELEEGMQIKELKKRSIEEELEDMPEIPVSSSKKAKTDR